ncbi:hypothetical protein GGI24_001825 [Coemansia furcata]|nr:hypothetical protein GGI24_001825 [Coemansia furcata]
MRLTATIEFPVNIEAPVLVGSQASYKAPENNAHPDMMDINHGDAQAPVNMMSGKRGKRSTAEEKQLNKDKRADALEIYARYRDKGLTIQDLLASEGIVVRMDSLCNDRSLEQLVATPFVPIVFRALNIEPAHYIVDYHKAPGSKIPNQVQGFHEYGVDGFPVPVVPERWLSHQRRKYKQWCGSVADCKEVHVANSTDVSTCQSSSVYGLSMCCDCITRQENRQCRFRWIRVITRLDIVASNNSMVRRYIVAPMFTSQADGATTSLIVTPTSHYLTVHELDGDRDDDSTTPAEWSEFYALYMTAPTLFQVLDVIVPTTVEHAEVTLSTSLEYSVLPVYGCSVAPCVYRSISPGFRQLCDICATSIMSVCFTCCMCATEMCVCCFSEWDDDNDELRVSLSNGPVNSNTDDSIARARRLSHCKIFNGSSKLNLRLQAQHKKRQFIRVSQFSAADIHQVLEKVHGIIHLGTLYPQLETISCTGVISDTSAQAFAVKINWIEQRTRETYPHEAWELPVIYVQPNELTTAEFSCLWRRGMVVVVRGLLSSLKSAIWKPEWWIKHFGDEVVSILDCANGAKPVGGEWPLRNFYRLFDGPDKYAALFDKAEQQSQSSSQSGNDEPVDGRWAEHKACVEGGILKLKDWPPTDHFENRLPVHFRRFMDALPFPEYTQRLGKFNLVNRLPAGIVKPDLGPKMYCAYGSSDAEGGVGTTNLHCDMADAVNIMAYAPPEFLRKHNIKVPGIRTRGNGVSSTGITTGPAAAAVWDIYPPEAIGDLRTFIGKKFSMEYTTDCSGPIATKYGDPVHNQETYLTQPMRKEFYDQYGHNCYRVYQNPGDAVFVPAGCAHQVCNYASAVKIAMDFVSPERVNHSRRLTEEFRQLSSKHPRNQDLLQLGSILWWTFADQPVTFSEDPRDSTFKTTKHNMESISGSRPNTRSSSKPTYINYAIEEVDDDDR